MAILTVGLNKQYASLHAALDAARDGDVVNVSSGLYTDDIATIRSKVTLNAVGGKVTLLALAPLAPGQAVLTVTTDATINGFVFAGAKATDGTAAGLLDTGGALTLRNTLFTGDQTGLVVRGSATGTVVIQGSEFAANGIGDGFSGNISVGAIAALTITDSYVHDAAGDEISSLAKSTVITGTRILDSTVPGLAPVLPTADVNLPSGGVVLIQNSVLEKAANGAGPAIRVGGGTPYAATSITITGDTIVSDKPSVSDKPGATLLQNATTTVASITGDQIYGFGTVATGPAVQSANTVPATRPVTASTPLVVPGIALPVEYGRAGAVVANGTVLTVGAGGSYRTLTLALAAAHDGDTIRVAAGTYTETGVVISHKVIIEGVGGLARFVAGGAPANGPANATANNLAGFTTTTDVTLRNIELTGAGIMGGVAAGIHDQGGNLTVVNSYIHDNQAGLVADAGLAGSIGVYDTELARNGTVDGVGANLDVGEVGTLTLRNVWVHAAVGGAELRSRADTTTIDASRILQSSGSGANAIDLPQAGRVSITGSVIEKAAGSLGGALVHVGGSGMLPGSGVVLANDTLISDVTAAATRFVVAEAAAGGMVALAGVVFEGGAPRQRAGGERNRHRQPGPHGAEPGHRRALGRRRRAPSGGAHRRSARRPHGRARRADPARVRRRLPGRCLLHPVDRRPADRRHPHGRRRARRPAVAIFHHRRTVRAGRACRRDQPGERPVGSGRAGPQPLCGRRGVQRRRPARDRHADRERQHHARHRTGLAQHTGHREPVRGRLERRRAGLHLDRRPGAGKRRDRHGLPCGRRHPGDELPGGPGTRGAHGRGHLPERREWQR